MRLPFHSYNNLIYAVTITIFFTVAIDTEISFINENNFDVIVDFVYELVQAFFLSDYVGKLANSWSKKDYQFNELIPSILHFRSLFDFFTLLLLITDYIPNQSP